jgi:hypothetical protein
MNSTELPAVAGVPNVTNDTIDVDETANAETCFITELLHP